jgi:hypothetical protein
MTERKQIMTASAAAFRLCVTGSGGNRVNVLVPKRFDENGSGGSKGE